MTTVSDYPYMVEDDQECLHVRPRRDAHFDHAYNTLKVKVFNEFVLKYFITNY